MNAESPKLTSIAASPLHDVLRLHRRICLLRANGHTAEAARLESDEFAAALASMHDPSEQTNVVPLLAAEANRVSEAVMLAEVLAPLLASRLADQSGEATTMGRRGSAVRPAPTFPPRSPTQPILSVADFIEGMLVQERSASRPD